MTSEAPQPPSPGAELARVLASMPVLERLLERNILPFWDGDVVDSVDGGYRLNHDQACRWKGPADKHLVTQARTLWFFSRLTAAGRDPERHASAARHGFAFLAEHMWDREHGGFYWAVNSGGRGATKDGKHLYAQAFALMALSEFSAATGSSEAADLARELFALVDRVAHDGEQGGYREMFRRDWGAWPERQAGYLGLPPAAKLVNTHLHLLEALTAFVRLAGDPIARERLHELVIIQGSTAVRRSIGVTTDVHRRDWKALRGPAYDRVVYGHELQNSWLLREACVTLGLAPTLLDGACGRMLGYVLRFGYDREQGGWYHTGPLGGAADRREKVWWVQADGLLGMLEGYRMSGVPELLSCYHGTLDWIVRRQADWDHGEWHDTIAADGSIRGDKAGPWKCPYHGGRALLRCLDLLPSLAAP